MAQLAVDEMEFDDIASDDGVKNQALKGRSRPSRRRHRLHFVPAGIIERGSRAAAADLVRWQVRQIVHRESPQKARQSNQGQDLRQEHLHHGP